MRVDDYGSFRRVQISDERISSLHKVHWNFLESNSSVLHTAPSGSMSV